MPDPLGQKFPVVLRVDGTIPPWDWFVLGERDRAARAALEVYADVAETLGYDPAYVEAIRMKLSEWRHNAATHPGTDTTPDTDRPREERQPDPMVRALAMAPSLEAFQHAHGQSVEALVHGAARGPVGA